MKGRARTFLIVAGILVLMCVAFLWFRAPMVATSLRLQKPSISLLRSDIENEVKTLGAENAYEAFKKKYEREDFDVSHNAAHIFGESLFSADGIPGVATCDATFNFGCYHGFFTAAVQGSGLEIVSKLDAACAQGKTGASACQHGIGHGILEFLGHEKLLDALTACGRTNQPDPLAGCTGGVFMEYNVPLVATADGTYQIQARPLTNARDPYAPCPSLPTTRFQASCYQELAQWWKQVLPEDFGYWGKLCEAVPIRENQGSCFAGISKMIPSSVSYSVEAAEKLCKAMPGEWYDRCIMNAAWAFESNVHQHADAVRLCSFASNEKIKNCPR